LCKIAKQRLKDLDK